MLCLHYALYFSIFVVISATDSILSKRNLTLSNEIDRLLQIPTRDLPNLNVMLRAQHYQLDAENSYVQWFLEQSHFSLTVSCYDVKNSVKVARETKEVDNNRGSFAIVVSMQSLRRAARRFVQRAGTFFFILADELEFEDFRNIFASMWNEYKVFKSYLLTDKGAFIYDPFDFDVESGVYGKIVTYKGIRDLERTLFSDMRGYPMRIQIFKSVYSRPEFDKVTRKLKYIEGVDARVAKMLQQCMNFTMILQEPNPNYFGERNRNGSYNGVIGSIIKKEIDLCLTGFFVKDYMVPEMDFTVAVYDDQLCIYVPKAKRVPPSILPIFSVGYELWLCFVFAAFACATLWWIMRTLNLCLGIAHIKNARYRKANHRMQCLRIYIDTWVLWVRVNIVQYPPFYSERIYIATLCLVSVIFGAIFESSLATVYIHPMYYKDVNTLRELDESGFRIIYKYSSMADDLFFSETSPLFASLNKKLTYLNNLNADVILDIAQNGGKAGVTRHSSLMLESLHFIISKRIWVVPECPKYYTISYVMPKDSPWSETVNNLLLHFQDAGLIKKWISEMHLKVDIKIMKEKLFDTNEGYKILTVVDLQLAFYVMVIGSILGAFFCIIETFCGMRRNKILPEIQVLN